MLWEDPIPAHRLRRLASHGRLVLLDLRGMGSSSALHTEHMPPLQEWMDDLSHLLAEVQSQRAVLFAYGYRSDAVVEGAQQDVAAWSAPSAHPPPSGSSAKSPGRAVEAGGIEPPSEGDPPRATTCVAYVLMSRLRLPQAGSSAPSGESFGRRLTGASVGLARSASPVPPLRAQGGRTWLR